MATSSQKYPADVQSKIDGHLDAIDRVLAQCGIPRTERLAITNEVEHLIRESLARRDENQPTSADVDAVLMDLDPPESYGETKEDAKPKQGKIESLQGKSVAGHTSLWLSVTNIALVIALIILSGLNEPLLTHSTLEALATIAMLLFVVALGCGIIGRRAGAGKIGALISGVCLVAMLFQFMSGSAPEIPDYGDQFEKLQNNDPPEAIPTAPSLDDIPSQ